ncbi:MAG: transcriptional regulator [Ruminococcus flavefaciens]|nr:transcriptional regulator [Ruminococcus flavefaciens]
MSDFVETLNLLIFDKFKDAKTFAAALGIDPTTVTRYLGGKRAPSVQNLVLIADYFNCSCDYLLGFEGYTAGLKFKPASFTASFNKLTEKTGFMCLSKATGISVSSLYDWKSGKRLPDINNLIKLAKHFDCRVDFILGRES